MKTAALATIVFVAGSLAYVAWRLPVATHDGVAYRIAHAERGAMPAFVSADGTVNAVVAVQVRPQIPGQIITVHVDFNSEVKRGQVLARLDPEAYELRLKQANADLEAARSALAVAENAVAIAHAELARARVVSVEAMGDLERRRTLVERGLIHSSEYEEAEAAHRQSLERIQAGAAQIAVQESQAENARAAIRQREAGLARARIELERTFIRAPVDGTVIARTVDAGQFVAPSRQLPALFIVARDLREMQVEAVVDEAGIDRIRVGQAATFTVDAFPRRTFEGRVVQIRKAPRITAGGVAYTAVISAQNGDLALLPGMTATVRIATDERPDVLKVPNTALRFRPAGLARAGDGASFERGMNKKPDAPEPATRERGASTVPAAGRVWTLGANGAPVEVPVRTGRSDGVSTEVVSDRLTEGTPVIVGIASSPAGEPRVDKPAP